MHPRVHLWPCYAKTRPSGCEWSLNEKLHFKHGCHVDVIDAARQNMPGLKLALLLDESDFILKIEDRLQNVMRAAFQSLEVGADLRVVVAGTTDLSTYIAQRSSPFFNHFRFVPLKPLSDNETRDLIMTPAGSFHYTYDTNAVEQIAEACGGQPYYCQRICYEAFNLALTAQSKHITFDDAAAAVRKVVEDSDAYNGFVASFWDPSPPREPLTRSQKQFLKALAKGQATTKFQKQTVKRLLEWQLVRELRGSHTFSSGLFRAWVERALAK
jgi:hypothetical protein